jgi:hypothetical protein
MRPGFHRRLNVLPRGKRGGVLVFRHCMRNFTLRLARPDVGLSSKLARQIADGNFV